MNNEKLEDKLEIPDCALRFEIIATQNSKINLNSVKELVKRNSNCYACPYSNEICTVDTIMQHYEELKASRGIPSGITIHSKTLMAGFVEGSHEYKKK